MKALSVLSLATLLLPAGAALARIGETREEIDQRYGKGEYSDTQRLDGAETIKYHFRTFQIEVVFAGNKSIWEIIKREDRGIDSADIRMVLRANAGDGRNWHYNRLGRRWERSGDPLYIAYLWPGYEDYLCIEDVKACEAIPNSQAGELGGF